MGQENLASVVFGHTIVPTAAAAVQIGGKTGVAVPDGFALVIKANPNNTVNAFLATSKAAAEAANGPARYELKPNEGLTLQVKNTNILWGKVGVDNESFDWAFEKAVA